MAKDTTGSKTPRDTQAALARKRRTRCSFNDEGLLLLLTYINTHLDDFRNDHWKAYKACAELMPQDPRTKGRYTEKHLFSKVSHVLQENMKREFDAKGNRSWWLFTYGSQILELPDKFWYNKAYGSILSSQLETSLPRTVPNPYNKTPDGAASSGASPSARNALDEAEHGFEPRVQGHRRRAAQEAANRLRESSLDSIDSIRETGGGYIVAPPQLASRPPGGKQQPRKDIVPTLLAEQIEVGLYLKGEQEPILRYTLPSVGGAQDGIPQRSLLEETLEPQSEQDSYPVEDAAHTLSTHVRAPGADGGQHAGGNLQILRAPLHWRNTASENYPHRKPNLLQDWTNYGLKKAMRDLFDEINDNAIKAMTRKDWLKALIAAAVTVQVLQADVPKVCYEQNTFLKVMDVVLSHDPDLAAFEKQLYREVRKQIVSRPNFITSEINQKASAMGYDLGYALRPILVRTVPGASMLVSANAGQPLHTHLEWQKNRSNIYRKCLELKAQLSHSEESLRFAWPTTACYSSPGG
ncbi:MAG: hypothetical protein M1830_008635 [Pleopsidium flavum]|nr:MAG: hypothetical protein M1830_008635 [Pleopsidium flavum]